MLPWLIISIIDDYVIPGDLEGMIQMVTFMALTVAVGYFADSIYTFTLVAFLSVPVHKLSSE